MILRYTSLSTLAFLLAAPVGLACLRNEVVAPGPTWPAGNDAPPGASEEGTGSDVAAPAADLLVHLPLSRDLEDLSPTRASVRIVGSIRVEGGVAHFPGDNNWLELPAIPFARRAFAVAMWIEVGGTAQAYGLLEQRAANVQNQHLHLMLRGMLQPRLGFYVNDARSMTTLPRDTWVHLLFQYTGTHQQIWIDGVLDTEREAAPYEGAPTTTAVGRNPRWSNVDARDFEGRMRDLRVYGRALTLEEIGALSRDRAGSTRSDGDSPQP
jgi:hypothetical protein